MFSLFVFSTDLALINPACQAGVEGVVVDWEQKGKEIRQAGADTQINYDTFEDLVRIRRGCSARIISRINSTGPHTEVEVEQALEGGADEILIPMVRSPEEVKAVLGQVGKRAGVGILIETMEAVQKAPAFAPLPLSRVYVGLNDLMIDRGDSNIFLPVIDGTLERIRRPFQIPFGFGGLTLPEKGSPIPCCLLIDEMVRLKCQFSFLRRSFHQDVQGREMDREIPRILEAIQDSYEKSPMEREGSRVNLVQKIRSAPF